MDNRKDLIEALTQIQNHPAHGHHDILTIHFCAPISTDAQLRRAIEDNMATIAKWSDLGGNKRRFAKAA